MHLLFNFNYILDIKISLYFVQIGIFNILFVNKYFFYIYFHLFFLFILMKNLKRIRTVNLYQPCYRYSVDVSSFLRGGSNWELPARIIAANEACSRNSATGFTARSFSTNSNTPKSRKQLNGFWYGQGKRESDERFFSFRIGRDFAMRTTVTEHSRDLTRSLQ